MWNFYWPALGSSHIKANERKSIYVESHKKENIIKIEKVVGTILTVVATSIETIANDK